MSGRSLIVFKKSQQALKGEVNLFANSNQPSSAIAARNSMTQHFDITLGLTVREFAPTSNPLALPSMRFQIGETRTVFQSVPPMGRTLPVGYAMNVPVFHVLAMGETFQQSKKQLKK
jgi:hypothetical protein